jgi:hypothetical protein
MGIALDRELRQAIYADVVTHLSAIGDVHLMLEQDDFTSAQRLGREFQEDLRLLDDLGWAVDDPSESFKLTMPLEELARVVQRLHDRSAEALRAYTTRDRSEEDIAARHAIACSAYGVVYGDVARLIAGVGQPEENR